MAARSITFASAVLVAAAGWRPINPACACPVARSRCAPLVMASARRRAGQRSPRRPPSLLTRIQQARTAAAALDVLATASPGDEQVLVLERVAVLLPRAASDADEASDVRRDRRLLDTLDSLGVHGRECSTSTRCAALWSLGMIYPPRSASAAVTAAAAALSASLVDAEGAHLAALEAAGAVWACETLGVPPSAALARASEGVPFRLHVRAVEGALSAGEPSAAVRALAADIPWRRDEIASGSAEPSARVVVEDRETCWLSDEGLRFDYSGKRMASSGALSGRVGAVRDAVRATLGDHYESVLINHYPDGGSGMRFHADPGQGEQGGWGYSTAVVSCGETRLFTFRRADAPDVRLTFAVRHGDVLHMHGDCQQAWQHSVVRETPGRGASGKGAGGEGGKGAGGSVAAASGQEPALTPSGSRLSFVFKRSLRNERRDAACGELEAAGEVESAAEPATLEAGGGQDGRAAAPSTDARVSHEGATSSHAEVSLPEASHAEAQVER